jgi:hypothetical protein
VSKTISVILKMTYKENKDKYHAKKNNILYNERLIETEKDIADIKNWCICSRVRKL